MKLDHFCSFEHDILLNCYIVGADIEIYNTVAIIEKQGDVTG